MKSVFLFSLVLAKSITSKLMIPSVFNNLITVSVFTCIRVLLTFADYRLPSLTSRLNPNKHVLGAEYRFYFCGYRLPHCLHTLNQCIIVFFPQFVATTLQKTLLLAWSSCCGRSKKMEKWKNESNKTSLRCSYVKRQTQLCICECHVSSETWKAV